MNRSRTSLSAAATLIVAAVSCSTTTPRVAAPSRLPPPGPYVCTQVIGVAIAHEWYDHGFEKIVDDDRWQLQARKSLYIEHWRDPEDPVWQHPITSPCKTNADNPDRIIFQAVNWTYDRADPWIADLEKIVTLLRARYSNLTRLELITLTHPPNDVMCPDSEPKSVVQPFVDEALARVAANHRDLVTIGPKVYTPGCHVYLPKSAHWNESAFPEMARIYGAAYVRDQ